MKKFALYANLITLSVGISLCIFFMIVKSQVVNTFGFIENTDKYQVICDNFMLHEVDFGSGPCLRLVFVCDRGRKVRGKSELTEGEQMFINWDFFGDWSWHYASNETYTALIFDNLVKRKIEAYRRHVEQYRSD